MGKIAIKDDKTTWFNITRRDNEPLLHISFVTERAARIAASMLETILRGQEGSGEEIDIGIDILGEAKNMPKTIVELEGDINHAVRMLASGGRIASGVASKILAEFERQTKLMQNQEEVESQKEKETVKTSPASELAQNGFFGAVDEKETEKMLPSQLNNVRQAIAAASRFLMQNVAFQQEFARNPRLVRRMLFEGLEQEKSSNLTALQTSTALTAGGE